MRTLLEIARNDLRIIFNDRSIWINLAIVPMVLAIAVGFANGAGFSATVSEVTVRVDVLDADQSAASAALFEAVRAGNANLVLCPMDQTDDDLCQLGDAALTDAVAEARLLDRVALAQLEVPAGFGADLASGAPTTIVYRADEDANAPGFIFQAVQAAAVRVGGAQTAAEVGADVADATEFLVFADDADRAAFVGTIAANAEAAWATPPITVQTVQAQTAAQASPGSAQGGFAQSVPGMATMYVLFTVLPAAGAIILERKNWTLQRMATLPVSRTQILGGKLLARFTLGMVQYAILFGFGAVVLGVRYGEQPLAILPVMVAYTACVTALSLALSTLVTNDGQAQGITLFISLTLAPLGGAWWPLEIVPAWMRAAGHLSPVAWAMDGYQAVIFYGGGLAEVLVPTVVLALAAAALFAFGAARFRFSN